MVDRNKPRRVFRSHVSPVEPAFKKQRFWEIDPVKTKKQKGYKMTDSLSAAECALYAILFIPVAFLAVRHGIHGILGWLFLAIFCTLRIIGAGMTINDSSPAASIISNVGLSPMLLAAAGIIHEALVFLYFSFPEANILIRSNRRTYRIHKVEKKQEWAFALSYHIVVVAGIALTAAGSSELQNHKEGEPVEKSEKLVKSGMAILAFCWALLVAWTVLSFMAPKARNPDRASAGTVVCFSFPFQLCSV